MERISNWEWEKENVMHVPTVPALVAVCFTISSFIYIAWCFVRAIYTSLTAVTAFILTQASTSNTISITKFQITFSTLNLSCATIWRERERSKTKRNKKRRQNFTLINTNTNTRDIVYKLDALQWNDRSMTNENNGRNSHRLEHDLGVRWGGRGKQRKF